MAARAELSIHPERGRLTLTGLKLRNDTPFDAWVAVGRRIGELSSASAWWLGDWLVFGEDRFGDRYRTAVAATSLDYQTLRNYAWVARRVDASRRRSGLSLQHHAEVAALPEADQELWLRRAERFRWSRNELRRQLAGRRRRGVRSEAGEEITCRVRVPARREDRWREAAARCDQGLAEWIVTVIDAAADEVLAGRRPEDDVAANVINLQSGSARIGASVPPAGQSSPACEA
jgi:hypothetical protein